MLHPMIFEITRSGCEDLENRHFSWVLKHSRCRVVAGGARQINQLMSASLSRCEMSLACKLSIISSMSPSMKRSRL